MNTVTDKAEDYLAQETLDNTTTLIVHILFTDIYHSDHHIQIVLTLTAEEKVNVQAYLTEIADLKAQYAKDRAKGPDEDQIKDLDRKLQEDIRETEKKYLGEVQQKALKKAEAVTKKVKESTIKIILDQEFKAESNMLFYVVYQNGTRKHCCIYAKTVEEAITEFHKRVSGIYAYSVFGKSEGQELKQTGDWKRIPLETHLN